MEFIRAIIFCEFDNIVGPRIFLQDPQDFMSPEQFDCLSDYIITKPQLQDRVLTITTPQGHRMIGCPVCIEHPKYHRNALLFNACFVLPSVVPLSAVEPLVRKLALTLRTLETETEFLFKSNTKQKLETLLPQIRKQLNETGESLIAIDSTSPILLRVPRRRGPVSIINSGDIPVASSDQAEELMSSDVDLTLRAIVPLIDGQRSVSDISREAGVDLSEVKEAVQQLILFDLVAIIDGYSSHAIYSVTPAIRRLASSPQVHEACVRYVRARGRGSFDFRTVFRLYCEVQSGDTIGKFAKRHRFHELGVDVRRFVIFGLLNGILKRIASPTEFPHD